MPGWIVLTGTDGTQMRVQVKAICYFGKFAGAHESIVQFPDGKLFVKETADEIAMLLGIGRRESRGYDGRD